MPRPPAAVNDPVRTRAVRTTEHPRLHARQVSARDGELWCQLHGDRAGIAGRTVTYLRGGITV